MSSPFITRYRRQTKESRKRKISHKMMIITDKIKIQLNVRISTIHEFTTELHDLWDCLYSLKINMFGAHTAYAVWILSKKLFYCQQHH